MLLVQAGWKQRAPKMSDNITMKDVAQLAGVSLGTVSNVINNNSGVKKANRDRVDAAMRELEFVPNMVAKQLRSSKSSVIGLMIPTILNPYYPLLAQGISDAAAASEINLFLCITNRDAREELRMLNELIARQVIGIAIAKSCLTFEQLREYSKRTQIVLLDNLPYQSLQTDVVSTDNYDAVKNAVGYLCKLGHQKIGYLAGDLAFCSAIERQRGFVDGICAHGLELKEDYMIQNSYTIEGGLQAGTEMLLQKNRPTAIICANEMIAAGLYRAARSLNIRIPDDLSVIGCDNTMLAEIATPRLTTIDQQVQNQGLCAVRALIGKLAGNASDGIKNHIVSSELIQRDSCSSPK